jgi:hypothetical protein
MNPTNDTPAQPSQPYNPGAPAGGSGPELPEPGAGQAPAQYPPPYPPQPMQQPSPWYTGPQPQYQQVDPTPQLPSPQLPGQPQPQPVPQFQAQQPPRPSEPARTPSVAPAPPIMPPGQRGKKPLAIVVVCLLLLALAAGIYFWMSKDKGGDPNATPGGAITDNQSRTAKLSTLNDLTFIPPADLSRYNANPDNTELAMAYNTDKDACSLQLGVSDEKTTPGKDLNEIVAIQIRALRDKGVKVDDATAGPVLTLKDATNPNSSYTLPTLVFVATDGTKQIRSHYSAAVLKGDKRAYVIRTCQVAQGNVDPAAVQPLDEDASRITIITQ